MTDTPKVRALFERARNLPLADRLAFVLREAGDDADLANEVLSLLGHLTTKPASPPEDAPDDKVSLGGADPGGEPAVLDAIKNRESPSQRYRHVEEIARGGMGKVSQVRDLDLRRQLAMKVMLDEQSGLLPRFVEEAQVMGQLDHPNIVPVHELGFDAEGRVFFTMKLVKGETLRHVFDQVSSDVDDWNVTRALSVILRVCEALAFAHAKGVIHRDIKPGNIMVGRFGEVYVMDWGLARVLGQKDTRDLRLKPDDSISIVKTERQDKKSTDTPDSPVYTMDGAVVGTPSYMPPEQAEGFLDLIGPRSDVYAVGALLYRLLSGRDPYSEPGLYLSGSQIVLRVIAGPPQPLHELATDVPAELLAIQEKAMARKIDDRYPSMNALADDLRAYLEHRVVSAYETGAIAELKKWVERNQGLAAAAALLVCVLVGASVLFAAKNREIQAKNLALGQANAEITTQKAAVEAKNKEAENAKTRADRERDQVLRLADVKRLEQLRERQELLWPSFPNNVPGIEQWLKDAKALLDRLPEHRATRDLLREKALLYTAADAAKDRETNRYAGKLAWLREHQAKLEAISPKDADATKQRDEELAKTRESIATLEIAVATRRTYTFVDAADQWQHDLLSELVSGLEALTEPDKFDVTIAALTHRLEDARTIQADSIGKYSKEWDEAIAAVAADPKYHGLVLKPRLGLVPIGRDEDSSLFEFWHIRSGMRPERDGSHKIKVTEDMGLVFVLIPGGTCYQGAQNSDDQGKNYEPVIRDDEFDSHGKPVAVTLDAFFISKYECMQGQWLRLFDKKPSAYFAGDTVAGQKITLANPVEHVNWIDCEEATRRVGLALPTEAQWECAARGGSDTPWFFGRKKAELRKYGNIADKTAMKAVSSFPGERNLDDGYVAHAAVGSFLPNGFGLYDTLGNVSEWCRDGYTNYDRPPRAGDGERVVHEPPLRVVRGGNYGLPSDCARSAYRLGSTPEFSDTSIGLRPVLPLLDP